MEDNDNNKKSNLYVLLIILIHNEKSCGSTMVLNGCNYKLTIVFTWHSKVLQRCYGLKIKTPFPALIFLLIILLNVI